MQRGEVVPGKHGGAAGKLLIFLHCHCHAVTQPSGAVPHLGQQNVPFQLVTAADISILHYGKMESKSRAKGSALSSAPEPREF